MNHSVSDVELLSASRMTDMLCCVCGELVGGVQLPSASTSNPRTCSDKCQHLLVFLQGLVFGNALCLLTCNKKRRKFVEVISPDFQRDYDNNSTPFESTEKHVCVKSQEFEATVKCEADIDSNQDEDLLQVVFGEDREMHSNAGLITAFSQQQTSASGESEPSVNKLQQSATRKKRTNGPLSVRSYVSAHNTDKEQKSNKIRIKKQVILTEKLSKCKAPDGMKSMNDNMLNRSRDRCSVKPADTGKKRVVCGTCGEKFVETHLYVHMKAKHGEKLAREKTDLMFPCTECDKKFEKQIHLNKHLAKQHPSCERLTKVCTICHKGFSNQIGLSVHMRHVHKTLSPKVCDLCEKTFKSCKELSRHKLQDHKLRVHICHLCGKKFAYSHALKSHLDAHAGVKKHFCEVCGEGFVRMTSLCGHRASAHSKKEDVVYKCDHCGSNFDTKAFLSKHLFEFHFTGPYAIKNYRRKHSLAEDQGCQTCKDAKKNFSQCPVHLSEKVKGFTCSQCGKTFSRSHYLKAHEKQHQEAKFSCDICCKRFTYKCNLKAHRSTHSNDKPFQCSVCSKKFRLKFLLEDHQRTHNRDLLFKCYICGRGLTRIPNLKRHIKVMHPEVSLGQHVFQMQ